MKISYNRYDEDGYTTIWSNKKKGRPRVAVTKDKDTGDLYAGFEGFIPKENSLREILANTSRVFKEEVGRE